METFDERHNVITLSNGRRVFPENEPERKPKTRAEVQADAEKMARALTDPTVSNG